MPTRYLSAVSAARLLDRCSCPDNFIIDALINKAEYVIRLSASKRNSHIMWRVPVFASMPAYNFKIMQTEIAAHFRKQGFYVKEFPDGITLWISWRHAYQRLRLAKQKEH